MQSRPFAAWLAITLSVAVGFGLAQVSIAAPTAEQAKQMQAAEAALAKASNLAKGKQFEESGKLVAQSQQL
ncbi:MAG: hypothetical protein SGJ20_11160, partial [Planctomycetota bacterium]|nr:hypothetical protein [Planctomycetota bacterium]